MVDILSTKEAEIRLQLWDLISRGILVIHETPLEVGPVEQDGDGYKIKFLQKISLRVETMQYIEALENRLFSLEKLLSSLISEDGVRDVFLSFNVGVEIINTLEGYGSNGV